MPRLYEFAERLEWESLNARPLGGGAVEDFDGGAYFGRVDILSVWSDFAMYFKRTTQAVQRCKNEQQRCSYGRDWVAAAGTTRSARTTFII